LEAKIRNWESNCEKIVKHISGNRLKILAIGSVNGQERSGPLPPGLHLLATLGYRATLLRKEIRQMLSRGHPDQFSADRNSRLVEYQKFFHDAALLFTTVAQILKGKSLRLPREPAAAHTQLRQLFSLWSPCLQAIIRSHQLLHEANFELTFAGPQPIPGSVWSYFGSMYSTLILFSLVGNVPAKSE
jgi:hypothetical protein